MEGRICLNGDRSSDDGFGYKLLLLPIEIAHNSIRLRAATAAQLRKDFQRHCEALAVNYAFLQVCLRKYQTSIFKPLSYETSGMIMGNRHHIPGDFHF